MAENSDVELEEVAISVDTVKSLLHLIGDERNRRKQHQPSIFMVPRIYRDQNPSCFNPRVISIGPLHRGHKNVQEHEGLKGAYMHDLLDRLNSPPQQTLERCFSKVISKLNEIKLCYGGMNNYRDFDIAKMMVTDACFILEFIQKVIQKNFIPDINTFTIASIFTDLLLLENQIPFFVLQDIFDLTLTEVQHDSLITLLLDNILYAYKPFEANLKIDNNGTEGYNFKHILEILHKSCQPDLSVQFDGAAVKRISHSVVELDRAGVKFKPNEGGNMLMAMEYETFGWLSVYRYFMKPTLRLPVFTIQDATELLLRNLIAYEQSNYNNVDRHITSFAYAMDMLVDSTEDVVKLVESKVIINWLGSNEDAANVINNICNEVVCLSFMYGRQFHQLDDYYKSYWPKNMARLRRTYFNSPWNAIALVAGILLFALTAIQTIFTVMSA